MLNAVASWKPEQRRSISLIGYSDANAFRWWGESGLTVVDLPIGDIATDLCLGLIQRARSDCPAEETADVHLYDSRLILRGSVHPHANT